MIIVFIEWINIICINLNIYYGDLSVFESGGTGIWNAVKMYAVFTTCEVAFNNQQYYYKADAIRL